jgi:hypothetical protein
MAVSSTCTSSKRRRSGGVPTRRDLAKKDTLEERKAKVMRRVNIMNGLWYVFCLSSSPEFPVDWNLDHVLNGLSVIHSFHSPVLVDMMLKTLVFSSSYSFYC